MVLASPAYAAACAIHVAAGGHGGSRFGASRDIVFGGSAACRRLPAMSSLPAKFPPERLRVRASSLR
jgi:hypothetical protein